MAIITNTLLSFDEDAIREELSDIIYNIDPDDTPFVSMIGRESVENAKFDWQTDNLAASDTANDHLEGDDIDTFPALTPPSRVANHAQISRKLLVLSDRLDSLDIAGQRRAISYELSKKGRELRLDLEAIALMNRGGRAGGSAQTPQTAALGSWVRTNTDFGTGGVDPSAPATDSAPSAGRTDGTQRAFTETLLKNVLQSTFDNGAKPSVLMVGSHNRQVASDFPGIVSRTFDVSRPQPAVAIAAIDVYVGNFGTLKIVPNREQRARDAWLVDPEFAQIAFLRSFRTTELAKTGDATKRMLLVDWGLKVKNEAAFGLVADLTTS